VRKVALHKRNLNVVTVLLLLLHVLIFTPSLPVSAQTTGVITITMTGGYEISLAVSPDHWEPGGAGVVHPDTTYETDAQQFTLTVGGNCPVHTYIAGANATLIREGRIDPSYKWSLSQDGGNGLLTYALWFTLSDAAGFTLLTETPIEFCSTTLGPGDSKQFGVKLLTPQADFIRDGTGYFAVGNANIQARIILSAVAAA
jgi:hypothetical protein